MGDQSDSKTVRSFQCRDYLHELFDRMSTELDCSVDYLINEAMREYARARDYAVVKAAAPSVRQAAGGVSEVPVAPPIPAAPMREREPRMPERGRAQPFAEPRPAVTLPPSSGSATPPPLPRQRTAQEADRRKELFLLFNGQRLPVDKDEFIIGRGARSADLAIRDGNISRRHAAVVFHDGGYFMKDLGSTNGIEFAGQRVESKRIEDGDVYRLCDYELRFSFE